jgi:DNA repair exonuclease SbcCD ATPase subunit
MRLLELEIHNVRGITDLRMKPDGKNLVIWGPNGSGKSAVVDAIDFLLTGRVSRLTGEGTRCITLNKHGPHIDHDPEDAIVSAIIKLPGIDDPIRIKRCMANSDDLEVEESTKSCLEPIIELAHQGQHVLTRREVLKYITSEPGTRAQEIQALLNISEIEDIRKALVKVNNDFKNELDKAEHDVNIAREAINETIGEKTFIQYKILQFVNTNRNVLGGIQISTICSKDLKKGLKPPVILLENQGINTTQLDKDIQNLKKFALPQIQKQISQDDEELRKAITAIRSDPMLLRAISRLKLIQLGMDLIKDSGECPLCETKWPPGKLREHLEQRIYLAQTAEQYLERTSELSRKITSLINSGTSSIQQIQKNLEIAHLNYEAEKLQYWFKELRIYSTMLIDAIENYPIDKIHPDQIKEFFAPKDIENVLNHICSIVTEKCPAATPEQTAWDDLSHLEENYKALEKAQEKYDLDELNYQRAAKLAESFQQARDKVLGRLYDEIRDRFVQLYRQLHGLDEKMFTAKIEPERAGLSLEVDFYGRGTHPPQALHSEGHQDSMGLCLYLALAERLTKGLIDMIILDDVMMSVDADHRRQACNLLAKSFPDRQFLITTHDKTWANQLRA